MYIIINDVIDKVKAKFEEEGRGRELKNVHVWSDGCAGQFKNRNQMHFVVSKMIRVVHHFFASCHGKGPSDSEGAVVKSMLRMAELILGCYLASAKEAYEWLEKNLAFEDSSETSGAAAIGRKQRHTIPLGKVNHAQPEVIPIEGLKSAHYFDGALGAAEVSPTLTFGELRIRTR